MGERPYTHRKVLKSLKFSCIAWIFIGCSSPLINFSSIKFCNFLEFDSHEKTAFSDWIACQSQTKGFEPSKYFSWLSLLSKVLIHVFILAEDVTVNFKIFIIGSVFTDENWISLSCEFSHCLFSTKLGPDLSGTWATPPKVNMPSPMVGSRTLQDPPKWIYTAPKAASPPNKRIRAIWPSPKT